MFPFMSRLKIPVSILWDRTTVNPCPTRTDKSATMMQVPYKVCARSRAVRYRGLYC